MPGSTTEYGFPYPIGSDPLQDGDNEIQNLAEAVETTIGKWQAYTPTISGIAIGAGSITGRYRRDGDTVFYRVEVTLGAGAGESSALEISLPADPAAGWDSREPRGEAMLYDSSAGENRHWRVTQASSAGLVNVWDPSGASQVQAGVPWAWGSGDKIILSGCYEAS